MFREKLNEMIKAAEEAAAVVDTIPTIDDFLSAYQDANFANGIGEVFASSAVTDLHVGLKQLFQFVKPDQPFGDDLKGDIKAAVQYLSENFESTAEALEYVADNTMGFKLNQDGEYFSVKPIIEDTIGAISRRSKLIIRFAQRGRVEI